jgi:hypothetical protein
MRPRSAKTRTMTARHPLHEQLQPAGRNATVQSGRRDPRNPDHHSFSRTARRAGALGDPAQIGISDIAKPDYGDAVTIRPTRSRYFGRAA